MAQFNDMLKIFDSAQNQYWQLREEEDGADTCFEDSKILITGCLNSSTIKLTIG